MSHPVAAILFRQHRQLEKAHLEDRLPRKLAAILYADVAGYSRLTGEDEDATHRALREYLDVIASAIESHRGQVVHYAGDAVLAKFDAVVDALSSAVTIQTELKTRNHDLPDERRVQFRVGVNSGDVIEDRGEIYGDGVNVAARLETLAEPGGICISDAVRTAVGGKLDLVYKSVGEREVKNIKEPVRAYKVVMQREQESVIAAPETPSLELPDKPSIAVLPFSNMSGDPEQEYFSDGVTEDIITGLSKAHWLFVIARTSSFTYKGQAKDVKQIGRELGVRYTLEGSVRKSGNRVRVTSQLIDVGSGTHIWAERYDRDLDDIFAVQDEITEAIVAAVEPELGEVERERAIRKLPETLDAWDACQRGLWYLYRFTKEDTIEAKRSFSSAIEKDPNFAAAHAHLAIAGFIEVLFGFTDSPGATIDQALESGKRGIALDEKDPVAHFAAGRVYMMRGEHEASIAELEMAIDLNPSFADAYFGLGFTLTLFGKPREALANIDTAMRLSPYDPLAFGMLSIRSLAHTLLGQYEEAAKSAKECLRLPRLVEFWPQALLAAALGQLGEVKSAKSALAAALRLNSDFSIEFVKRVMPTKERDGVALFLEGLRKAGLSD